MNTPSPGSNPDQASTWNELSLETMQEQYLKLKLSVEELSRHIEQTRKLIQTLIVGLVIAVLVTLGISGWFAYRLLVQEQVARRESEQASATNADLQEKLEQMTTQLQRQREQLQTLRSKVPDELTTLTDTVQTQQRQLELLSDRVKQLEPAAPSP